MQPRTSLGEIVSGGQRSFSFELFPPKTAEGDIALWQTVRAIEMLRPTFVSVTYGAGGSTRDRTVEIVSEIALQTTLTPVAHLTCVGASREELRGVIAQYAAVGVTNMLAIRGDMPAGPTAPWEPTPGGLNHAVDLVELIRSLGEFTVGVAAFPEVHPESADIDEDARVLASKQDAGAEFAVTNLFFRVEDYERLIARAAVHGCTMPIVPGIMPVTNVSQIERFTALSGAVFPVELAERFQAIADDTDAVIELGIEVAAEQCQRLLDGGAPGLHFYTLNRSHSTIEVYEALGLGAATG